jgi:membrane protease YdiL (CAAX protease family)
VRISLFSALLILWGNLLHPLIGATALLPGGSWAFVVAGAALVAVSLVAARALGLDASRLGVRRAGAVRAVVIGLLAGGAIALLDVALIRLAPAILGAPIVYTPLLQVTPEDLALHVTLFLPLGAVIPEEIAFRGTLLGALLRSGDVRRAVAGSALTFALWHATVAIATVFNTQLPEVLIIPAIAGALVVVFVGGVVMATLRLVTGALSTSIAAHWAFNAVILVGLWSAQPRVAYLTT